MNTDFYKAPLHIERTGTISIKDSTLILRAGLSKAEFLSSDLWNHVKSTREYELENGVGYSCLVLLSDRVFENVHLRLAFENDRLGSVSFGWGPRITTSEWTEERIQIEVERYRAFLNEQLGPIREFPCDFPWGSVYAAKDDKAGAPKAVIRYAGFEFRRRKD